MIGPGMMISDRYEIIDKVGSGGMADVYKAKDHRLNRFVAIKVLRQEYSSDAKFVAKFRAEAQSVAGLSHPNIVNVYDVDEDENYNYIVMELVEGITLKKFIEKKGKLEVNEAVGIAVQIAQGMEAAHDNHIIHRDIKPQNIIISKEGKVKVTDFGIAKAATSNTITSNAMGSVHYISPEQARGGYSDEKSDIYSLGVTMYEMLSGNVPFEGDSTVAVALSHIQEEAAPLHELDPEIPMSLSKIVRKCMQKKPELRYLNAAALIADLKRAVSEPDGEYVKLESMVVDPSPTKKISDIELNAIKEASRAVDPVTDDNFEEEPYYEDDAIDPKLEKILKICSAVVAVIIIIGVVLIIGKFAGWWGHSGKDKDVASATATPTATAVVAEDGQVVVPGIIGKSLEYAEQLLTDKNLHWQLKPIEADEDPNIVTDQEPAEGEIVDEGARVTIYYSQGDSGVTIPANKPIVGESVFTQVAGVHADGDNKNKLYFNDLLPERFGRVREYALGKNSGKANIRKNLESMGLELDEESMRKVTERIIELGDRKELVTPEDLPYIISDVLKHDGIQNKVKLLSYFVTLAKGLKPMATLSIEINGKTYQESSSGDGQYDAFVRALRKIYKGTLGRKFPMLLNYAVTIPPGGRTDAFVQTVITWNYEDKEFRTRGFDADQTEAAIKATIKMLNMIEDLN